MAVGVFDSGLGGLTVLDAVSKRRIRVARHLQLAAVGALGVMFQMKEMEAICEGEFDGVFVPLLTAMGAYMGVGSVENDNNCFHRSKPPTLL